MQRWRKFLSVEFERPQDYKPQTDYEK